MLARIFKKCSCIIPFFAVIFILISLLLNCFSYHWRGSYTNLLKMWNSKLTSAFSISKVDTRVSWGLLNNCSTKLNSTLFRELLPNFSKEISVIGNYKYYRVNYIFCRVLDLCDPETNYHKDKIYWRLGSNIKNPT